MRIAYIHPVESDLIEAHDVLYGDGNAKQVRPVWDDEILKFPILVDAEVSGDGAAEIIYAVKGLESPKDRPLALCFSPRHAVVVSDKAQTTYLICFECWRAQVFKNGVQKRSFYIKEGVDREVLDSVFIKFGLTPPPN